MAGDLEQELLQDFLLESREIVDELDQQLVALERNPDDAELLSAIFRGFHTIKGGAGFLDIAPMVTLCHEAEELFNQLRHGDRRVSPELMDASLAALDSVKTMFSTLESARDAEPAPPRVLNALQSLVRAPATQDPTPGRAGTGEAADEAFDALLEDAAAREIGPPASAAPAGEEVDEAEFEAMLDELYGPGVAPGADAASPSPEAREDESGAPAPKADDASPDEESGRPEPAPPARRMAPGDTTIRVNAGRVDELMNLVGELVLARNRLLNLAGSQDNHELVNAVSSLDHIASSLQDNIMHVRMQPVRRVFSRFPRVIRDLARQLGKDVDLVLEGESTELDKNLIEEIADPLVHLLRNAVDHGLEDPQERARIGKPKAGQVRLSASQEGDHILLVIEDDGRGIDPQGLRRSAVGKGLIAEDAAASLSDSEAYDLMFMPGFSTRNEVSDISGRGVGMDVVRTRIAGMNGTVKVDSTPGRGSRFTISLPLTLAILPTMMVGISGNRYALPLNNVREIADLAALRRHRVEKQDSIVLRGQTLPLMDLRASLGHGAGDPHRGQILVLIASNRELAVAVDEVLGQQDVVVKPLGPELSASAGISGSTITGDGSVALILDLDGLVRSFVLEKAA